MPEKFTNTEELFASEPKEGSVQPEKIEVPTLTEPIKSGSERREVITLSNDEQEERHPFQEVLYRLRDEGVLVSTSEWLDLQTLLNAGEVQNLDELYIVSRAVLVKDVTDYQKFDNVFGEMFYGIEPPDTDVEEEEDYYDDEYVGGDSENSDEGGLEQEAAPEDEGSNEKDEKEVIKSEDIEQKDKEEIEKVEEATSETSEDVHGGEEATKDIEDSPNPADEGKDRDNKGAKKGVEGKEGGYASAKERILERNYEEFMEDRSLSYEHFGRALSKLRGIVQETTSTRTRVLDAKATVQSISEHAGAPELLWKEEIEEKPDVVLMFDVGGSTDEFRPILEQLFTAAKDELQGLEIYYFHNAIYGEVWPQKDGNYGKNFVPLGEIMKRNPLTKVIIIGDAWMADYELLDNPLAGWGGETIEQGYDPKYTGIYSFKELARTFENIVWVNPIPERDYKEWDMSGTIARIKEVFPMYDLTLQGLEGAVRDLMT